MYAVILWVVSSRPVGGTKEPKRSPSKGGKPILEVFWNTEDKEHHENSYTAFDKVVKSYILTWAWATFKLSVRNFIYKAANLLLNISRLCFCLTFQEASIFISVPDGIEQPTKSAATVEQPPGVLSSNCSYRYFSFLDGLMSKRKKASPSDHEGLSLFVVLEL